MEIIAVCKESKRAVLEIKAEFLNTLVPQAYCFHAEK
jgi:hypothetical protein